MKIFLRKPKLLLCVLGCFLALLLMAKIRLIGYVIGSDGLGYYAHLRSAFIDKDLHYANEFLEYNPFNHHVQNPHRRSATDHVPNKYYIGPALLWTPFFLVAHSLTLVVGKFGFILEPDGYSVFYQFFIGLGSVIYGLIGLVLIYKIVLRFFSQKEALLATGLITFSTNVSDYLANEPSMSHALSLFGVSLFVYLWLKDIGNRQHKTMIWLGLTAGLMVLCRPQNLLFTVLLLVEWLGGLKSESSLPSPPFSKRLVEGGFFGGAFLFMLVPQFIVWKILYGQFLYFAYRGKGFDFLNPHLVESLFSARHGLISWTPVIFLALTGVLFFLRKQPKFGTAFLCVFLLQWYLNASWGNWWFGHSFGNRAYVNCSVIFALGLAAFLEASEKWKKPVYSLLAMLTLWNFLFMAQYTTKMVPQGRAVDWNKVLTNQFKIFSKIWELLERLIA